MNITKNLAEEVADKMVSPLNQKIKDLCDERSKIAFEAIQKTIPKEVIDCFNRFKSYFNAVYTVTLRDGSYEKRISKVPLFPHGNSYYPYIETDTETINKIGEIDIVIKSIEEEMSKTRESIISTLLSLRTFKRAKESFPEAYKYMSKYEDGKKTAIALPVDNIMNTLKKYSV